MYFHLMLAEQLCPFSKGDFRHKICVRVGLESENFILNSLGEMTLVTDLKHLASDILTLEPRTLDFITQL